MNAIESAGPSAISVPSVITHLQGRLPAPTDALMFRGDKSQEAREKSHKLSMSLELRAGRTDLLMTCETKQLEGCVLLFRDLS